MIWGNPWAWAGLGFLALPVLIHLLGRGQAQRRVFPTLRFLPASRSLPTRRRRIRDPLLLAVRLGILASAVIALAQPFFLTSKRHGDLARGIARALIVDTSESMHGAGAGGRRPLDIARARVESLSREAQTSLVIESAAPRRALAQAVSWTARQRRRAEVVIISDFQTGTIDARDLGKIPKWVGIRLSRVDAVPGSNETVARIGDAESVARVAPALTGSTIEWATRAPSAGLRSSIRVLAGATEQIGVEAAQRAASSLGVLLPLDSNRSIAIVYPGYERRAALLESATPLRTPWMTDVVARLRADSTLIGAASAENVAASKTGDGGALVVARTDSGRPAVVAVQGQVDGRDHLLLMSFVDASSLTSAALISAATRALSNAAPTTELEPTTVPDDLLRSWQREPDAAVATRPDADGASDGRWAWIVALVLLAVETWLRRARREEAVSHAVHDRAA